MELTPLIWLFWAFVALGSATLTPRGLTILPASSLFVSVLLATLVDQCPSFFYVIWAVIVTIPVVLYAALIWTVVLAVVVFMIAMFVPPVWVLVALLDEKHTSPADRQTEISRMLGIVAGQVLAGWLFARWVAILPDGAFEAAAVVETVFFPFTILYQYDGLSAYFRTAALNGALLFLALAILFPIACARPWPDRSKPCSRGLEKSLRRSAQRVSDPSM